MPNPKKRTDFYTSNEGVMVFHALESMVSDAQYMTDATFSSNTDKYSDNLRPFIDKHMDYLQTHPATDAEHYLANLKIMTRIRQ